MSKVTIYTTPTCVYRKMTKAFFKENNVVYEEKDVSTDAMACDEMIAKSNQMGVPVSTSMARFWLASIKKASRSCYA